MAYTTAGRTAVAPGHPIGPGDGTAAAVEEFVTFCRRNDWLPAFYQTLPDYLESYRAAGLIALCVGHEAIVDLQTFTLEGGAMKTVRGAVNHLTRLGYRAAVHTPQGKVPSALVAKVSDPSGDGDTAGGCSGHHLRRCRAPAAAGLCAPARVEPPCLDY